MFLYSDIMQKNIYIFHAVSDGRISAEWLMISEHALINLVVFEQDGESCLVFGCKGGKLLSCFKAQTSKSSSKSNAG